MMKDFVCLILTVLAVTGGVSATAPKPAVVQEPYEWTIGVTFEHPQQITQKSGKDGKSERYWYVIITLNNETNRDVDFYPECELVTDTFEIMPAGKGVPASVFKQIKRRHRKEYPFLESLEHIDNKILQGEDNMRDIAIIWPDFDARANAIKIFIAGLSNETVAVEHPTAKDETGEPVKVYLRKTLELSYSISGDAAFRTGDKLVYEGKRWIMR